MDLCLLEFIKESDEFEKTKIVQQLECLAKEENVEAVDSNGMTALMYAAYLNPNMRLIQYLISSRENVFRKSYSGECFADILFQNRVGISQDEILQIYKSVMNRIVDPKWLTILNHF